MDKLHFNILIITMGLFYLALSTIIVFQGEEEIGRFVSGRGPGDTPSFLETAREGEGPEATAPESPPAPLPERLEADNLKTIQLRINMIVESIFEGEYGIATEHAEWLWKHAPPVSSHDMRNLKNFLSGMSKRLVALHPPARELFERLRDEHEAALRADRGTWKDIEDWVTLSDLLGHREAILEWADRVSGEDEGRATVDRLRGVLERIFRETKRPDLLLLGADDPAIHALRESWNCVFAALMISRNDFWTESDEDQRRMILVNIQYNAGASQADWYVALLHTGRHDEAEALARVIFEPRGITDPRTRAEGFAERLERFGVEVPDHVRALLDGADEPARDSAPE